MTEDRGDTGAFMHIGEVAARTDLSLRSLRHWEEVGLLHPSSRSEGGFRLYTDEDVEKILVIRRMKPLGYAIEEMKAVMSDIETLRAATADPDATLGARRRLDALRQDASERRQRLVRQVEMADEFLELVGDQLTSPQP